MRISHDSSYTCRLVLFESFLVWKPFYIITARSQIGNFPQMKCLLASKGLQSKGVYSLLSETKQVSRHPWFDEAQVHPLNDRCTCTTACLHQRDLYIVITATD